MCTLCGERSAGSGLDVDLHRPLLRDLLGERPNRRLEPVIAERDRLDVERQVAERLDRLAVLLERRGQDPARIVVPAVLNRMVDRVEHQRDPGERLHGTVVELQREPPALVLLGRDPLLVEANPLAFLPPPLALPALDGLISQ